MSLVQDTKRFLHKPVSLYHALVQALWSYSVAAVVQYEHFVGFLAGALMGSVEGLLLYLQGRKPTSVLPPSDELDSEFSPAAKPELPTFEEVMQDLPPVPPTPDNATAVPDRPKIAAGYLGASFPPQKRPMVLVAPVSSSLGAAMLSKQGVSQDAIAVEPLAEAPGPVATNAAPLPSTTEPVAEAPARLATSGMARLPAAIAPAVSEPVKTAKVMDGPSPGVRLQSFPVVADSRPSSVDSQATDGKFQGEEAPALPAAGQVIENPIDADFHRKEVVLPAATVSSAPGTPQGSKKKRGPLRGPFHKAAKEVRKAFGINHSS